MRKVSPLLGLTLVALGATARAEAPPAAGTIVGPAPIGETPAPPDRKLQVGLSFLPMAIGKVKSSSGLGSETDGGAFAYGFGFSASYEVLSGLSLGVAPQVILNGKVREAPGNGGKEFDFMARVAYGYAIPDAVTLYAEVLPGYSVISPPTGGTSKGLVVAVGGGAAFDMTARIFANLGVGYQYGFQKVTANADYRTDYLRVALGGGVRF